MGHLFPLASPASLRVADSPLLERRHARVSSAIASAVAFVEQHYLEQLTWGDVARSVYRHKGYLAARFRRETGLTMRDYVRLLRMQQAGRLVDAGEKIESVMLSVGYHSKRTFYARFREMYGVTPGEYRRVSRKNDEVTSEVKVLIDERVPRTLSASRRSYRSPSDSRSTAPPRS